MDQYLIEYFQSQTSKLQNTLNIVDKSNELLNINHKNIKKSLIIKNKFHDIKLSNKKHKLFYNNIKNGPFIIYTEIPINNNSLDDIAGDIWQYDGPYKSNDDKKEWKLRAKGYIKNGKLFGYVEQFYPDLYDISSQLIKNNNNEIFIDNCNLLSKTYYDKGIKQSIYQEFYIDGSIKLICNYINNKKYGLFVKYHQNGNMCIKCEFFHDSMINNYKVFHYNGSIKLNYNYNINGYLDGEIVEYYNNKLSTKNNNDQLIENSNYTVDEVFPKVKLISNYCNGELNGNYMYYHNNQKLKINCSYVNHEIHGLYKEYDERGNLILQCNYNNGELHGPYMKYNYYFDSSNNNSDKKIYSLICNYYYGKVDGLYREIINGETSDTFYKNGRPVYQNSKDFDIVTE